MLYHHKISYEAQVKIRDYRMEVEVERPTGVRGVQLKGQG